MWNQTSDLLKNKRHLTLVHGLALQDRVIEHNRTFWSFFFPYNRFGHLACFTADVEVFLQILPGDRKKQLLDKLVKSVASSSTASKHVLGQHITLFKIRELIGDMFPLPERGKFLIFLLLVDRYSFCNIIKACCHSFDLTSSKETDKKAIRSRSMLCCFHYILL